MSLFSGSKKNPGEEENWEVVHTCDPIDKTKVVTDDEDEAIELRAEEFFDYRDEDTLTDISEAATSSSEPERKPRKMEEIYSTKDKRVRFKKQSPIEAEAEQKRKQITKEDLIKGKMEFSAVEEDPVEVALEAEPDPDAVIAEDIIEDIKVKNLKGLYVQDIEGIDISLDPNDSLKAYQRKANDTKRRDLRAGRPSGEKRADVSVTRVPVYRHESNHDAIFLKAGRFTDVVESEYDEYLKSTDPTISKNYHAAYKAVSPRDSLLYTLNRLASLRNNAKKHKTASEENPEDASAKARQKPLLKLKPVEAKKSRPDEKRLKKVEKDKSKPSEEKKIPAKKKDEKTSPVRKAASKKKKKPSNTRRFFKAFFFSAASSFVSKTQKSDTRRYGEYRSHEDERYVLGEVKANIRKLGFDILKFSLIAAALLVLVISERVQQTAIFGGIAAGALLYCLATLLLLLLLGVFARSYILNGLRPLKRFSGNCDTTLALAYFACVIQAIVAVVLPDRFVGATHHLYAFIPALGFILNTVGRLFMALRVKRNFNFITSRSPAYAAKIYDDEETARRMVSGTTAPKGVVAYQHITRFLSDFLKISYAPDPSEETCSKATPIAVISALFVAVAYGFIFKDVSGVASALSVMLCVAIPFCALLIGNIPMLLFSKRMLKFNSMVSGYPSVKQFCDTSAFMVYADELFPKGTVTLEGLKTFQDFRVEDSLINAAVVLKEARSPLARVFDELLEENAAHLPKVESVMYEDKSGVVGWVSGERVLVGNMALMNRYHITVPKEADEERYRGQGLSVAYIASAGQLVAMAALTYTASKTIESHLRRAENNGVAIVVATTDPNVTADLIADEYGLFHRSVKVLPTGYAGVMDEVTSKVEETSRAYLATRGKFSSMCRAICGCVGLKSNITVGIVIEMFALILGILLCATMALYASVARLSIVEMLIYILFWIVASVVSTLIRRP